MDQPVQRVARGGTASRAPHTKQRTGCITCKARHVKCDEKKPTCARCEMSRRTCQGYEDRSSLAVRPRINKGFRGFKNTFSVNPVSMSMIDLSMNKTENRVFDFFLHQTLPLFESHAQHKSWSDPLIRIASAEPTIKHCCLAIGSLHEHLARQPLNGLVIDHSLPVFATKHLTQSMTLLRNGIANGTLSLTAIRLACILLTIYESINGHPDDMAVHLRTGIALMMNHQAEFDNPDDENITGLLTGLGILYAMYARPKIIENLEMQMIRVPMFDAVYDEPVNLDTCRDAYLAVLPTVLNYVNDYLDGRFPDTISAAYARTRVELNLDTILGSIQALVKFASGLESMKYKLLQAQAQLCKCFIDGHSAGNQIAFDRHLDTFRDVVILVESVLDQFPEGSLEQSSKVFSLDLGYIPMLWSIGGFCREAVTRRKTVSLLKRVPRREGVWDADVVARCIEVCIEFEERGLITPPINDPSLIVEHRRIWQVEIEEEPQSTGPLGKAAVCFWRPDGPGGDIAIERVMI